MALLSGRLGLDTVRIPHNSRHGYVFLERGSLSVESGCLTFSTTGFSNLPAGTYELPHQSISTIILGPGTSISHDAFRIASVNSTQILITGSGGVRVYCAPPLMPDRSKVARNHATLWADPNRKLHIARKMYAWRLGEVFPARDLDILRGIEGSRMKSLYKLLAQKHGIEWDRREYDRNNPTASDDPNMAINHTATAMYAAGTIATYIVGAIPQLGFIHEASGDAFCLDIADLYRDKITIPIAFAAVRQLHNEPEFNIERHIRQEVGNRLKEKGLMDDMIDKIKELLDGDDSVDNDKR